VGEVDHPIENLVYSTGFKQFPPLNQEAIEKKINFFTPKLLLISGNSGLLKFSSQT